MTAEFGWKLQPPETPAAAQVWEEFVSESEDWEEDYASQVTMACDYLELCGYTFEVRGFGKEVWPVTVGYDLSTVLEDMPDQLDAMVAGRPAKIDMYAPGTEVEIDAVPVGSDVELKCTAALWEPEPGTIVVPRVDFLGTVRAMLADFSAALGMWGHRFQVLSLFLSGVKNIDDRERRGHADRCPAPTACHGPLVPPGSWSRVHQRAS